MDAVAEAPGIFTEARTAAVALGRSLSASEAATVVPSCPGWTVRDVFAHVTGILDDLLHDRLEGLGTDAWTSAQVSARANRSLTEICDEYQDLGRRFDAFGATKADLVAGGLPLPMRVAADLVVHLSDIRSALGRPADRSSLALRLTLARYAPAFLERAAAAGLDPVCVL
jgi:uncharacterized protein (TIGR03083 family)